VADFAPFGVGAGGGVRVGEGEGEVGVFVLVRFLVGELELRGGVMGDEVDGWGLLELRRGEGVAEFDCGVGPEDGEGEIRDERVEDGGDDFGFLESEGGVSMWFMGDLCFVFSVVLRFTRELDPTCSPSSQWYRVVVGRVRFAMDLLPTARPDWRLECRSRSALCYEVPVVDGRVFEVEGCWQMRKDVVCSSQELMSFPTITCKLRPCNLTYEASQKNTSYKHCMLRY